MTEFIRVYDASIKRQYSIPANGSTDGLEVLDGVTAVDHNGDALPPADGKSKAAANAVATSEKES